MTTIIVKGGEIAVDSMVILVHNGDFVARVKLLMEKHYSYVVSERPIIRSKTEPVKRD